MQMMLLEAEELYRPMTEMASQYLSYNMLTPRRNLVLISLRSFAPLLSISIYNLYTRIL